MHLLQIHYNCNLPISNIHHSWNHLPVMNALVSLHAISFGPLQDIWLYDLQWDNRGGIFFNCIYIAFCVITNTIHSGYKYKIMYCLNLNVFIFLGLLLNWTSRKSTTIDLATLTVKMIKNFLFHTVFLLEVPYKWIPYPMAPFLSFGFKKTI